jgi:hypothetical protein
MDNFAWADGTTNLKCVKLEFLLTPRKMFKAIHANILLTCRKTYNEAVTILYSHNVFHAITPEDLSRFFDQISTTNVKCIRFLDLWVGKATGITPWLGLLHDLAADASGLRFLKVELSTDFKSMEGGLGYSLDFVRALGNIQGLEQKVIKGFYASR